LWAFFPLRAKLEGAGFYLIKAISKDLIPADGTLAALDRVLDARSDVGSFLEEEFFEAVAIKVAVAKALAIQEAAVLPEAGAKVAVASKAQLSPLFKILETQAMQTMAHLTTTALRRRHWIPPHKELKLRPRHQNQEMPAIL